MNENLVEIEKKLTELEEGEKNFKKRIDTLLYDLQDLCIMVEQLNEKYKDVYNDMKELREKQTMEIWV